MHTADGSSICLLVSLLHSLSTANISRKYANSSSIPSVWLLSFIPSFLHRWSQGHNFWGRGQGLNLQGRCQGQRPPHYENMNDNFIILFKLWEHTEHPSAWQSHKVTQLQQLSICCQLAQTEVKKWCSAWWAVKIDKIPIKTFHGFKVRKAPTPVVLICCGHNNPQQIHGKSNRWSLSKTENSTRPLKRSNAEYHKPSV